MDSMNKLTEQVFESEIVSKVSAALKGITVTPDEAKAIMKEVSQHEQEAAKLGLGATLIREALGDLNATQVSIIKDGIEQHGCIGHYGRNFITTVIMCRVNESEGGL